MDNSLTSEHYVFNQFTTSNLAMAEIRSLITEQINRVAYRAQ